MGLAVYASRKQFMGGEAMGDVWIGMDVLAEYIGEKGAVAFCRAFGGVSVHIPRLPERTGRIAQAVGVPCAVALSRHLGGCYVTTPISCRRMLLRPQVEERLASGMSPRACALEVGCTERYARIVARRMKERRAASA